MDQTKVLPVNDIVSWVGVLDEDIVTFDIVMETHYGTTYNAYFIDAEKKVVIDTVKKTFQKEFIQKISTITDPAEIDYIICNHTEPDHSGSLTYLLDMSPNATVIGSGQALNYLSEMIDRPFQSMKVRDGDSLDLGNRTLRFIGASNLHWPDTIYTYLEEDNILFTCDSFGSHYSDERMFDDLAGDFHDAFRYYFDVILKPFSRFMLKAIDKIDALRMNRIIRRDRRQIEIPSAGRTRTIDQEKKQCLAELKRLGLWFGDLTKLMELSLPLAETVQQFEVEYSAAADERRGLEKDRKSDEKELKSVQSDLKKLEYAGEVPSEESLLEARTKRDHGWQLIKRNWLDKEDVAKESHSYDPETPLPEAFENKIENADQVADRLRREADRVANSAALRAKAESLQDALDEYGKNIEKLDQREEKLAKEWTKRKGLGRSVDRILEWR